MPFSGERLWRTREADHPVRRSPAAGYGPAPGERGGALHTQSPQM